MDFPLVAQTIIFVSAVTGLAIVAPLWLTYSSNCFLTVLTESTVGDREVRWADDNVLDMWWQPLYCLGMLVFWASVGSLFLAPLWLANPWVTIIGGGLFLWYAYPIGLLCVMDSRNSIALIYMPLLARLVRHLSSVLLVGLATLPLGAAVAGLLTLVMLHSTAWAVPAAMLLPLGLFLYARAWGRLAWMVLNVKRRRQREKAPLPKGARVTVLDPWALPPEEPIPEMNVEVEEPDPAASSAAEDDEWAANPKPYQVPAAPDADAPLPFSNEEYYKQYRKREEERKARAEGRKPGQKRRRRATLGSAFGAEFWPFLGELRTLRSAATVAALTLGLLVLLRIAVLMVPGR
jgi:hypothetical protein